MMATDCHTADQQPRHVQDISKFGVMNGIMAARKLPFTTYSVIWSPLSKNPEPAIIIEAWTLQCRPVVLMTSRVKKKLCDSHIHL